MRDRETEKGRERKRETDREREKKSERETEVRIKEDTCIVRKKVDDFWYGKEGGRSLYEVRRKVFV